MTFIDDYINFIIKQYWDKPNARAETGARAERAEQIFNATEQFKNAIDIDTAEGDQLDKIGKKVGIGRSVNSVLPKPFFGFSDNQDAKGFGDLFAFIGEEGSFKDLWEQAYTAMQLSDTLYRRFIKAKIANNNCKPSMIRNGSKSSVQDAVLQAFNGKAYISDNKNMTMTLYVSPSIPSAEIKAILELDLIPRAHGVRFGIVMQAEPGRTFGFSDNPNALGLVDLFDSNRPRGYFSELTL